MPQHGKNTIMTNRDALTKRWRKAKPGIRLYWRKSLHQPGWADGVIARTRTKNYFTLPALVADIERAEGE